jgi:hypothetical protein
MFERIVANLMPAKALGYLPAFEETVSVSASPKRRGCGDF